MPADNLSFSIKPKLCMLSEEEEICEDQLVVSWSSDDKRSLCLFQQNKQLPLRCWEKEYSGSHNFTLSTANDIEFKLIEMADQRALISELFVVQKVEDEFRRRRRNPWSFL